jgi:TetR/AcrR family transcriptional repressor of nem operon
MARRGESGTSTGGTSIGRGKLPTSADGGGTDSRGGGGVTGPTVEGGAPHRSGKPAADPPASPIAGREARRSRAAGIRQEIKRETREALLRAGLAEFAEKGIDVPSLDAICARAGFTRGAFYVHFADRDAFVVAVMESVIGDFLDAVVASDRGGDDLGETVSRFVRALVAGNPLTGGSGSMHTHRLLDVCTRSPEIRARLLAMLAGAQQRVAQAVTEGQEAGTVRRDLPADTVAATLVALAMGVVQVFELGAPVDVDGLRAAVLGLLAPPVA